MAVDTVKFTVATVKLIYIILIALTVVVCISAGLMMFVYLIVSNPERHFSILSFYMIFTYETLSVQFLALLFSSI